MSESLRETLNSYSYYIMSEGTCRHFDKHGWCKFGHNCRYLHKQSLTSHQNQPGTTESHGVLNDPELAPQCEEYSTPPVKSHNALREQGRSDFPEPSRSKPKPLPAECNHFNKFGKCRYGSSCRFLHRIHLPLHPNEGVTSHSPVGVHEHITSYQNGSTSQDASSKENNQPMSSDNVKPESKILSDKPKNYKICRFFKIGHCCLGEKCKFWHPQDPMSLDGNPAPPQQIKAQTNESKKDPRAASRPVQGTHLRAPVVQRQTVFVVANLREEDAAKERAAEIDQLKKRYPKAIKQELQDGSGLALTIKFHPTDPDWAYDIKELEICVTFPADYPLSPMHVMLIDDQILPDIVRRTIQSAVQAWINNRAEMLKADGKAEMVFKPFTRWLDKHLEEFFTEGLKKYKRQLVAEEAGVQFIPASELQESYKEAAAVSSIDANNEDDGEADKENTLTGSEGEELSGESDGVENSGMSARLADPTRRGTEIKLQNLQLGVDIGTVIAAKIKLVVQCNRCRNAVELVTPVDRVNAVTCDRCSEVLMVKFRSSIMHQFASIAGYLDLGGCVAFDLALVDCEFLVGCLNCSKDMTVDGLASGQVRDMWCHHCHRKLTLATESVRFTQLQSAEVTPDGAGVHVVQSNKARRVLKDPAIQEGKPLPNNGSCKHYKKSYRWFRFPCCGKTYPCDLCHDENETDHEMKYANRMICGYCCKEQPYAAERPCIACLANMTRKSSAYWEGGKGCRDKITMSRCDPKKYSNTNKTVSRQSQDKAITKKVTKPRHV